MPNNDVVDQEVLELERKARELTRLMFAFCEKRLAANTGMPTPEHLALAATAVSLQKSIAAFLAVEKLCE
ncbi:MAG: hypothetical protein DELT_02858 [Desulfovibrio sp.]